MAVHQDLATVCFGIGNEVPVISGGKTARTSLAYADANARPVMSHLMGQRCVVISNNMKVSAPGAMYISVKPAFFGMNRPH